MRACCAMANWSRLLKKRKSHARITTGELPQHAIAACLKIAAHHGRIKSIASRWCVRLDRLPTRPFTCRSGAVSEGPTGPGGASHGACSVGVVSIGLR